jgi:hypothetical protein
MRGNALDAVAAGWKDLRNVVGGRAGDGERELAVGDLVVEPPGEGREAAASPLSLAAGQSRMVCATVTYTRADARAAVMTTLPRRTRFVYGACLVLLPLIVILAVASGEPMPRTPLVALGTLALLVSVYVVVMPRQIVKANPHRQSWTISAQGVHITLPGTDVSHDWSRFDEVVVRPALVQFRIGRGNLSLPRRCLTEDDLPMIEVLATSGSVTVRRGGRFR